MDDPDALRHAITNHSPQKTSICHSPRSRIDTEKVCQICIVLGKTRRKWKCNRCLQWQCHIISSCPAAPEDSSYLTHCKPHVGLWFQTTFKCIMRRIRKENIFQNTAATLSNNEAFNEVYTEYRRYPSLPHISVTFPTLEFYHGTGGGSIGALPPTIAQGLVVLPQPKRWHGKFWTWPIQFDDLSIHTGHVPLLLQGGTQHREYQNNLFWSLNMDIRIITDGEAAWSSLSTITAVLFK